MEALLNLQHPGALSALQLSQGKVLFTLFNTSHCNQAGLLWDAQPLQGRNCRPRKSHPGFCSSQTQLGQVTKNACSLLPCSPAPFLCY